MNRPKGFGDFRVFGGGDLRIELIATYLRRSMKSVRI
jgi:hypothetical protein